MNSSKVTVPGYRGLEEVGRGGAATVFKATDTNGKTVAIKILSGIWNDSDKRRFEREKNAMQILDDIDGVVPLLDSGNLNDGTPYLVTPFFANGSMQDLIENEGPVELAKATAAIEQVAATLKTVHSRNIYHRDIKPGNLLIGDNQKIWISDFGITQISDGRSLSTTVVYTPGYCPPEGFTSGRENTDGTALDLYSLAATMWALLAGHQPFYDSNEDQKVDPLVVLNRVNSQPIGSPTETTPNNIVSVLNTATAKNPEDRYKTLDDFIEQLTNPNPKVAAPPTIVKQRNHQLADNTIEPATNKQNWLKSRSFIFSAAALVLLVAGLVTLMALSPWRNGNNVATPSSTTETESTLASPTTKEQTTIETVTSATPPTTELVTTAATQPIVTTQATPATTAKPTDAQLTQRVKALMPAGLTVEVTNGVADISGTVPSGTDVNALEATALSVDGIVDTRFALLIPPVSAVAP